MCIMIKSYPGNETKIMIFDAVNFNLTLCLHLYLIMTVKMQYIPLNKTVCTFCQLFQLLKHKKCLFRGAGHSKDCSVCSICLWLLLQDLCRRISQQAKHVSERPSHLCAKYALTVNEFGLVCSSTILEGIFVPQLDLHKDLSDSTRKLVQMSRKKLGAIWATTKHNNNETRITK